MTANNGLALTDRPSPLAQVADLEKAAVLAEEEAARRGWGAGSGETCVFPVGRLIDALLDLRAAVADSPAASVVDRALDDHVRRPGASTTAEVKSLCRALRSELE
jgi:hypothetical protein